MNSPHAPHTDDVPLGYSAAREQEQAALYISVHCCCASTLQLAGLEGVGVGKGAHELAVRTTHTTCRLGTLQQECKHIEGNI
jgi:hypothetical protein